MSAQKTIVKQKPAKITFIERSRPNGSAINSAKLVERRNKIIISRMKKEK